MRCLISTSSDPYFNLAMEDYLLKNSNEEHFLIYINEPCIVVGKHQNLLSEINSGFVHNNNIKLARRISGGGTVYQDFNNLNFSFLHNCTNPDKINFTKFTAPVLEALKEMGLDVEFSGRHDLLIRNKKISGNAMHIFKSRVLSHGTLLYYTDLTRLSAALSSNSQKYFDKSIKSVRSPVTNISAYLTEPPSIAVFAQNLFNNIVEKSAGSILKQLTRQEVIDIQRISTEKYATWDWIFGYSPKYSFRNSIIVQDFTIIFELQVEKGIIRNTITNIEPSIHPDYHLAFAVMVNAKHDFHFIVELLENNSTIKSNATFNITEFCDSLF